MRILVIEDEKELARVIVGVLSRQGHVTESCEDGAAGLATALKDHPDLIVLDLGLPSMDGFSVLKQIRQEGCPARVLILTARGEVEDRIAGLRAGADDYLVKPFATGELVARVEAVGRRHKTPTKGDHMQLEDLVMDVRHRKVTRGGVILNLAPREFELLQLLMEEPGRVFSRGELCERVWHHDYEYETRTVDIFIARLRRKVDAAGVVPLIHTVRSVGYTVRR